METVTVRFPRDRLEQLDDYVREESIPSRSEAVRAGLRRMLRRRLP